jgi:branched-chain amino acid transport system permease protein
MDLLFPALVGGVTAGALYGLLAFSVVVLYKATGVANFAAAIIGTLGAFFVWRLVGSGLGVWPAVFLAVGGIAVVGALAFVMVIRPRPTASPSNVIVRTLALALVIKATVDHYWAVGQPFAFPQLLPSGALEVMETNIQWATVVTLGVAAALVSLFAFVFQHTDLGLQLRALAVNRDIAQLLGVRYNHAALLVWAVSAVLALVVALLSGTRLMLSTSMLDGALLYSFAGAITFGLTSLPGAVLGGLAVGVLNSVVSTYASSEAALITVFAVLILTMLIRPNGIFGPQEVHRV